MLGWLFNERAIEPHIPVFEKSAHLERILRHDQAERSVWCPRRFLLAAKVQNLRKLGWLKNPALLAGP